MDRTLDGLVEPSQSLSGESPYSLVVAIDDLRMALNASFQGRFSRFRPEGLEEMKTELNSM